MATDFSMSCDVVVLIGQTPSLRFGTLELYILA